MGKSDTLCGTGRILIVEDDEDTRWLLKRACQIANYGVEEAYSGKEAVRKLERQPFDVMVLDLQLPDMHGVDVLNSVGSRYPELITIILTANPTRDSAIAALKKGAADYLCKPAAIKEILESISTKMAQRAQRQKRLLELGILGKELVGDGQDPLSVQANSGNVKSDSEASRLQLNQARQEIQFKGQDRRRVSLTQSETEVMAAFMNRVGEVLSNQEIAYEAWGEQLDPGHAASVIRPVIFRLRHKLEPTPSLPRFIRTVRGAGYYFDPD